MLPEILTQQYSPSDRNMRWESRTRFSHPHRPWDAYTADLSDQIEGAFKSKQPTVNILIKGREFHISFAMMTQTNAAAPKRVRDIRRVEVHEMAWAIARMPVTSKQPCQLELCSDDASACIEHGTGDRGFIDGAVTMSDKCGDGKKYNVDKMRLRAFPAGGRDPKYYHHVVPIPAVFTKYLRAVQHGDLPPSSTIYRQIVKRFNASKNCDMLNIKQDDLTVTSIQFTIHPDHFINFAHQLATKDIPKRRVRLVFHGTYERLIDTLMLTNFSLERVGSHCGNQGWFGKGIYLARQSFTALGYNAGPYLIASLVVFENAFQCPMPDSSVNPYHGKPLKDGHDAHKSPSGKELVIFNPAQILPCFKLRLSSSVYSTKGNTEYVGRDTAKLETFKLPEDDDYLLSSKSYGPSAHAP